MQDNQRSVTIKCTPYQAQIIKDACELYGRVQISQYRDLTEIIMGIGMHEPEETGNLYETDSTSCFMDLSFWKM